MKYHLWFLAVMAKTGHTNLDIGENGLTVFQMKKIRRIETVERMPESTLPVLLPIKNPRECEG